MSEHPCALQHRAHRKQPSSRLAKRWRRRALATIALCRRK